MVRKVVALIAFAALAMALAACNTVEGMGKDIKAGGQAIEKAGSSNKTY